MPFRSRLARGAASATPARSPLARRLFLLLAAVAVLYGFVSGLRTISDPDLFWQLATGRWVAQHHQVFSTDVFSYTAAGQPWIYPVGGSLLFYAAYLVGGYGLLSWIGAVVCVGTIALLLRRGTPITAALTIIAVPLIAKRSSPRAEIFTIILFAAFLSILWENYQTSRARLWLLLPLMLVWVNCHLGFVSGLALMVAFAGMDVLEMLYSGERRRDATQRLRRALPWFGAVALCTLANPWGWKIYEAVLRQNRAMAEHSMWIAEWGKVPLSRTALSQAFSLTNGDPFYLLAGRRRDCHGACAASTPTWRSNPDGGRDLSRCPARSHGFPERKRDRGGRRVRFCTQPPWSWGLESPTRVHD